MTNSTDVAIIGGGIMGGSIAYHLAKLGVKSTIFERESIGCEASGVATGMISAMSIDTPGPYLDLARASFEKYKTLIPEMEEASGVHTYYGEISWLDLAFTEEDEAANRANMEWRRSLMPKVSWVTDDDLYRIDPRITREARSGLYLEELNQADAYRLTLAYIGAAESLGVEVRYTDVKGLEKNGTRVTGIITDEEVVACGAVVLAMGAWTSEASDWIDTPVPIRPYKGQMVELKAPGPPLGANIHHGRSYVTSKLNGTILSGSYDGFRGYDKSVSQEGVEHVLEGALKVCPAMEEASISWVITGLRPATPDEIPILGPVPGLDGAFISAGHMRKGITLAAMSGEMIADSIVGNEPRLPIEPFSLSRFADCPDPWANS